MANPYQPPAESSEREGLARRSSVSYIGGFWGVAGLGVAGGLLVATIGFSRFLTDVIPTPFVVPGIAWIGAMIALFFMMRGSAMESSTKVWIGFLLAVPAYVLYVPVCTVTAMFSQPVFGSDGYGPTLSGLVFSSVLCFVGILLMFAMAVRFRVSRTAATWADANEAESESGRAPEDEEVVNE